MEMRKLEEIGRDLEYWWAELERERRIMDEQQKRIAEINARVQQLWRDFVRDYNKPSHEN